MRYKDKMKYIKQVCEWFDTVNWKIAKLAYGWLVEAAHNYDSVRE